MGSEGKSSWERKLQLADNLFAAVSPQLGYDLRQLS